MRKLLKNTFQLLILMILVMGMTKMFVLGFDRECEIQSNKVQSYSEQFEN